MWVLGWLGKCRCRISNVLSPPAPGSRPKDIHYPRLLAPWPIAWGGAARCWKLPVPLTSSEISAALQFTPKMDPSQGVTETAIASTAPSSRGSNISIGSNRAGLLWGFGEWARKKKRRNPNIFVKHFLENLFHKKLANLLQGIWRKEW